MNSACETPRTSPSAAIKSRLMVRKAASLSLSRGTVKVVKYRRRGNRHRRFAVLADIGKDNLILRHHRVDVVHIARQKLLEQVGRLAVAQLIEQ